MLWMNCFRARIRLAAVTAGFLLSGCGMRPCLHTTSGCETDRTNKSEPCRKFGGPTTGCHALLVGSPLLQWRRPG